MARTIVYLIEAITSSLWPRSWAVSPGSIQPSWDDTAELAGLWRSAARYEPELPEEESDRLLAEWRIAVKRALLLR